MSGKNKRRRFKLSNKGYALLTAIIAVNIFAILMLKARDMWEREMQRDLEAELLFRARQYVTAIELYRKKNPNMFPTSLELLYEKKFLRKLYKDPMTEEGTWNVVMRSGKPGAGIRGDSGTRSGRSGGEGRGEAGALWIVPEDMLPDYISRAMIIGVCSSSVEEGYLVYRKKKKYCEWAVYLGEQQEKEMPDLKFVAEGDPEETPKASKDESESDESGRRREDERDRGDSGDSGTRRNKRERE
jgi:type II secretory pathway pseudopilin PulG